MKIRKTRDIKPKTRVKNVKKNYKRNLIKKEDHKILKGEKLNEN